MPGSSREVYNKTDHEKFLLAKAVSSKLLKKYRLIGLCRTLTGVGQLKLSKLSSGIDVYRKKYLSLSERMRPNLTSFFERDVSRITTSKHDTVVCKKEKKQ